jgi:hypothetical protein
VPVPFYASVLRNPSTVMYRLQALPPQAVKELIHRLMPVSLISVFYFIVFFFLYALITSCSQAFTFVLI